MAIHWSIIILPLSFWLLLQSQIKARLKLGSSSQFLNSITFSCIFIPASGSENSRIFYFNPDIMTFPKFRRIYSNIASSQNWSFQPMLPSGNESPRDAQRPYTLKQSSGAILHSASKHKIFQATVCWLSFLINEDNAKLKHIMSMLKANISIYLYH